jgi:RNA polymerase sigma-70 factor (ECF subfamily)
MVLRAGAERSTENQHALSELIESYWYPLYAFCRRQGHNDHDAMDLTQGFFTHLLSGNGLSSVSPEKGRFRSFLLASFKNYMANQRRAAETIRRGGAVAMLSLNTEDFQARYDRELADQQSPDRLFERSWVESLLQRVRTCLADDYHQAGKSELYALLEPHLTHRGDALPRTEIAQQLNLSSAAVAMSIHRMRRRYGELLRQEVAATVDDPADVEDELRYLMAVVSETS